MNTKGPVRLRIKRVSPESAEAGQKMDSDHLLPHVPDSPAPSTEQLSSTDEDSDVEYPMEVGRYLATD